jgi:hypothetical protein
MLIGLMFITIQLLTQAAADLGFQYYFQRGMAQGTGIIYTKLGAVANDPVTVDTISSWCWFLFN